ncbi:30S ribosomal protein S16 [Rubinisphaera italica]|uniref:Small ribosomal subunit protein bS16 n=1 Tax=Rubinisphaera italica TaxID=2527969 RepID=A0A5C5XKU2_9PLAN|nr:30S ribosomal protein S16 [Rubinisphaera italica]TWT63051.1 30S ribosomal protein S16 [Rubinisphaera italica]
MSVRIRMKKMGRTHRPFYRICVMDSRKPRDGKSIEEIGTYDPMVREKSQRVAIKMDRIDYWLSVGAQPTEKVGVLIRKVREGDWGVTKEPPPMTAPKAPEPEAAPEAEASAEEAPAAEEATEG